MVTTEERIILQTLRGNPGKRKRFCNGIHAELAGFLKVDVSEKLVSGLEYLIETTDPYNLERKGVVINCKVSRKARKTTTQAMEERYRLTLFSKSYYLNGFPQRKGIAEDLDCEATISYDRADIKYLVNGRATQARLKPKEGAFIFRTRRLADYRDFSGVMLTGMVSSRRVNYGRKCVVISGEDRGSLVFLIEHKGNIFNYNLYGEMVQPCFSKEETASRKVMFKADRLYEEAKKQHPSKHLEMVKKNLKSRWGNDYESFNNMGVTAILSGEVHNNIGPKGNFNFMTGTPSGGRKSFYVGKEYHEERCRAEFKGPYVFFYINDFLVNGFRSASDTFEVVTPKTTHEYDYFRLRNIPESSNKPIEINTPLAIYGFTHKGLSRYAGTDIKNARCALACLHTKDSGDLFTLLVKEHRIVYEHEVQPCHVKMREEKSEPLSGIGLRVIAASH